MGQHEADHDLRVTQTILGDTNAMLIDARGMVAYWEQEAAQSVRREVELKEKFMALEARLADVRQVIEDHSFCSSDGCALVGDAMEVLDRE